MAYLFNVYLIKTKTTSILMDRNSPKQEKTDALNLNQTRSFFDGHKEFILSTAGILLTGSAIFASIRLINGKPVPASPVKEASKPVDQELINSTDNSRPSEAENSLLSSAKPTSQIVAGGTIEPNQNISVATSVTDEMNFETAYYHARQEVGPGGIFSWNGQLYNTFTQEEWRQMSLSQRQDFLSDIGFQPVSQNVANPTSPQEDIQPPHYIETNINGMRAIAIDENNDGFVESILMEDADTGTIIAFVDTTKDHSLDTFVLIDPSTMNIVNITPVENPRVIATSDVNNLNNLSQDSQNPEIEDLTDEEENVGSDYDNSVDVEDIM